MAISTPCWIEVQQLISSFQLSAPFQFVVVYGGRERIEEAIGSCRHMECVSMVGGKKSGKK